MPVCSMSLCVGSPTVANSTATPIHSPEQREKRESHRSVGEADAVAVMASSSSTDLAGCCAIGGRVRLRPDAVYVQIGDVDTPGARCVRIVHIGDSLSGKRGCKAAADLTCRIPDGDVLIAHSGRDFRSFGRRASNSSTQRRRSLSSRIGSFLTPFVQQREVQRLRDRLASLSHRHKILVPSGDEPAQKELQRLLGSTCHCLRDSSVTLDGVTFFGLSTPASVDAKRSNESGDADVDLIDVLVSHSAPQDQELAKEVFQRIRPKALLHGQSSVPSDSSEGAQWHEGILLSSGRLSSESEQRSFNKPLVIDFYTCRPVSGSQEYSEVMQTVGSAVTRSKKRSDYSDCSVL